MNGIRDYKTWPAFWLAQFKSKSATTMQWKRKFHSRNTLSLSLSVSRFPSTNVVTVVERRLSHTQNTDNDDIFFLHYCGLLLLFVFLVGENLLRLQTKKDSNDRRGSERANIHTHTLLIIVIAAAFFSFVVFSMKHRNTTQFLHTYFFFFFLLFCSSAFRFSFFFLSAAFGKYTKNNSR